MGSSVPRIRVLLVDDHDDTRDMYAEYLRSVGMDVNSAAAGDEGVQRALEWQPDVIVMDWSMPGLTGDEAARILKVDPRTRHIPVAILTAFGVARRAELEAAGAVEVCAKPCNPADLATVVRRLAAPLKSPPTKPSSAQPRRRTKRIHRPKRGARWAYEVAAVDELLLLSRALARRVRGTVLAAGVERSRAHRLQEQFTNLLQHLRRLSSA
jgi:CheY-like chemotaxis protein